MYPSIELLEKLIDKSGRSIRLVTMATIVPARIACIDDRKGSLTAGKDADIVLLDKELEVVMTLVKGNVAYKKTSR